MAVCRAVVLVACLWWAVSLVAAVHEESAWHWEMRCEPPRRCVKHEEVVGPCEDLAPEEEEVLQQLKVMSEHNGPYLTPDQDSLHHNGPVAPSQVPVPCPRGTMQEGETEREEVPTPPSPSPPKHVEVHLLNVPSPSPSTSPGPIRASPTPYVHPVFDDMVGVQVGVGETGILEDLTEFVKTVRLSREYTRPVVFAQPSSYFDATPVIVCIKNVRPTEFDVHLSLPMKLDPGHAFEKVSYMVVESGVHQLEDGRYFEAGVTQVSGTISPENYNSFVWPRVTFHEHFASHPVVLTQLQTEPTDPMDGYAYSRQGGGVSTHFFTVAVESDTPNTNLSYSVGYIAMEAGHGSWSQNEFEVGTTVNDVTGAWSSLRFGIPFRTAPQVFLADLASRRGVQNAHLRWDPQRFDKEGTWTRVQEDGEGSTYEHHERHGAAEAISWLAFTGSGRLYAVDTTNRKGLNRVHYTGAKYVPPPPPPGVRVQRDPCARCPEVKEADRLREEAMVKAREADKKLVTAPTQENREEAQRLSEGLEYADKILRDAVDRCTVVVCRRKYMVTLGQSFNTLDEWIRNLYAVVQQGNYSFPLSFDAARKRGLEYLNFTHSLGPIYLMRDKTRITNGKDVMIPVNSELGRVLFGYISETQSEISRDREMSVEDEMDKELYRLMSQEMKDTTAKDLGPTYEGAQKMHARRAAGNDTCTFRVQQVDQMSPHSLAVALGQFGDLLGPKPELDLYNENHKGPAARNFNWISKKPERFRFSYDREFRILQLEVGKFGNPMVLKVYEEPVKMELMVKSSHPKTSVRLHNLELNGVDIDANPAAPMSPKAAVRSRTDGYTAIYSVEPGVGCRTLDKGFVLVGDVTFTYPSRAFDEDWGDDPSFTIHILKGLPGTPPAALEPRKAKPWEV